MALRTIVKTVIALTLPIAVAFGTVSSPKPAYKIGVIQTIEHPALDETRKGIRDELSDKGFKENLDWAWDSAQLSQTLAAQIAQKYVGQEVNMIIGLGTMGSQAALAATSETSIPVVFASVTDPKTAKLVGNIAGVSNFVPVKEHFDLIQQVLPTKKRIGVIYNPGDPNSVTLVDLMQKVAKERGLELVLTTVTKTSEVPMATQNLIGKVDVILINNDNTALAAFEGIAQICRKAKLPLFASDADVLAKGALAVKGPDQYDLGRQTGRLIVKILNGQAKTTDFGTQYPEKIGVYLNEPLAKELGIVFPDALKKQAIQKGSSSS